LVWDGHHIKAVYLNCADDDDARKRAEQMVDGNNIESFGNTPAGLRGLMANENSRFSHLPGRPGATRRLVELALKAKK
jgi:hypothetical protein